ncbi:hypothetical protein VTJ04DRAFT_7540 [Mycothermus thermophilus]|uniref:uncharacterized protein n=1 Tax=Humicola insolens TaxID=85995 RepID=UPI0037439460
MANEADDIAQTVLDQFRKLPAKRKPAVRDNGLREWVPLSGIVVRGPKFLQCVALATGMKCLPASKLSQANGVAVHDWHAEVLVIRAFNRFLLDECRRLAEDPGYESQFLRRRSQAEMPITSSSSSLPWHDQPFAWREELTLHMYCSEAPCGDASMELIMASQEDATPWELPKASSSAESPSPPTVSSSATPSSTPTQHAQPGEQPQGETPLLGRGYFSLLGLVRRKPARADAPQTLSKSCSDKLALRQCVSLLSSPTALLVSPEGVYLSTLVLPASQLVEKACARCFSAGPTGGESDDSGQGDGDGESDGGRNAGRMAPVRDKIWLGTGYAFHEMRVDATEKEFEFSRRGILNLVQVNGEKDASKVKLVASNLAVAWTKDGGIDEGLVGGVLQGRKAFDLRGASATSRRRLWTAAKEVAALMPGCEDIVAALAAKTYGEVKECAMLQGRRRVKEDVRREALKGWARNLGDEGFSL